jgi:two-component system C4-dicarboxylate transport sensor histidine kinase DctB
MRVGLRSGEWRWLLGAVILAIAAALVAGTLAERRVLAGSRVRAAADVRLRVALLDSEIARFRLLPLTLADDRDVIAALSEAGGARSRLDRKLESLAHGTGAAVIYVVGPDGLAIAASNWRSPQSFVGTDYRFRPYLRDALARGEGSQYALGTVSRRPGLYLARRTGGRGVIVVKLEFDRVEAEWARAGGITFVRDPADVVLVTSRPEWRFTKLATTMQHARPQFVPLSLVADDRVTSDGAGFIAREMAVSQPGWRLTLLQPVGAAIVAAQRTASLGAALAAMLLVALAWALRQRVALARQRTAELEHEVAARTAELRREMDERAESEAHAAELREGLRQANRLAALGQITASVAHETAQPVAAIRTYAQTSGILLDRGALDEVRTNLGTIARLAERIGAVTAQLRGFSRRGAGELRPVLIAEVIDGALLILKEQLRPATLDLARFDPDLAVIGGKIRLEQVLVNLIQNALDALTDTMEKRIMLGVVSDETHVRLTVADCGPGVAPDLAARLFTPFVTSRPQGLGLGLVIAQDIMVELGGWLRLMPSDRGATFEVGLRRA